jgi:thiol:disulfide interchange protein DsbD
MGAFPATMRFLPKPGPWMDTFKHLMGFVLLATVIFLLTAIPPEYVIPTVGLLFGLWAACWWIGRISPLAEWDARLRAWMIAIAVGELAWLVSFAWLAGVMRSRLEEEIDRGIAERMSQSARMTGETALAPPVKQASQTNLPWRPFTRAAFEQLVAAQKTILIDFTADWCLTCKSLEALCLNTEKVRDLVDANSVVALKADWTDGAPEVTAMLELLGSRQVPTLAVVPAGNPNRPIRIMGAYTQQKVLDALITAGPSVAGAAVRPVSATFSRME